MIHQKDLFRAHMCTCTYASKHMSGYSLVFGREQDRVMLLGEEKRQNPGEGHLGCGRGCDDYCFSSFNFVTVLRA